MRTPFTSLLCSFTYRRGMQRGADCSRRAQRQQYLKMKYESIRSSEIFPENSKQRKVMYDCLHQPKPQFKMRSKCSTGESGREAICLQCLFQLLELSCYLYFFLRTKDLLPRPGRRKKKSKLSSINSKRHSSASLP